MKKLTMLGIAMTGILLQGVLLACAGTGSMQKDTMHETTMQSATMSDDKMQADHMNDNTMKNDKMMDNTMGNSMSAMLAGSGGHQAAGSVMVTREMGRDMLVLSDIRVEKVPDGHVFLARDGDWAHGIDLGILRQFSGNVSFALPAGTDPDAYNSVVIYCKQFHVEIGRAHLGKQM
jgi:Electron transfer DM13